MTKQCQICGRKFTSSISMLEHLKREHVGKLSKESFEYLQSIGVSESKISALFSNDKIVR